MKQISIATCFDYSIALEEQLPLIKHAGFTHFTIGGNYQHSGILEKHGLYRLKEQLTETGLFIDTIHGYALDKEDTITVNEKLVNAAVYLEVPVIVVHSSCFAFSSPSYQDRKRDIERKIPLLEQLSKNSGVQFSIENVLPGLATDFAEEIIHHSDPRYIGFCYDSSHDQIGGPRSFDLLNRLKNRLNAVHISDRIGEFTDHVLPGEGFIDFDELCHILKASDFHGPLLMEVMMTHSRYKDPAEFLNIAYQKALELYDKFI